MAIAVVIPAYNAESFIAATLDSVMAQTLPADEIVVVDDGSTDSTREIIARYPRVRLLRQQNQRAAVARNLGVAETSSEWIAFLDADDLWEPTKLERQMAQLARHPEAALCYAGSFDLRWKNGDYSILRAIPAVPATEIRGRLRKGTMFVPSGVVLRRDAFLAVGGFDVARRYTQDWDLWLRLMKAGYLFTACPEPLFQYRTHPNNMSSNTDATAASSKEVFRRHVLPLYSPLTRWWHHNAFVSVSDGGSACQKWEQGEPGALRLMLGSILRNPFGRLYRYKALLKQCLAGTKRAA